MAHGGGYLPHYFGRLDRNVTNMPESARHIKGKPSDYLASFYYDTCTYNPSVIEALVRRVGADRLVMGSDYAVGDPDPIGLVKSVSNITEQDRPAGARRHGREGVGAGCRGNPCGCPCWAPTRGRPYERQPQSTKRPTG